MATFKAAAQVFYTGSTPSAVVVGDFDGNGRPDVAVSNRDQHGVRLVGQWRRHFPAMRRRLAPSTGNSPVALAAGDVNGDTAGDLAIANLNSANVSVLLGTPTTPPLAALVANSVVVTATGAQFDVTYTDANADVSVSTIDSQDVLVTGPNSFSRLASLVSVNPSVNGSPLTATYSIAAPAGLWLTADNGTYTITMQANQVSDVAGHFVAGAG